MKTNNLAILLLAIGLGSLVLGVGYSAYAASSYVPSMNWNSGYANQWMMERRPQYSQQQLSPNTSITLDQAKQIAQQYLASTGNSNLAIKEIMEFQNNFCITYYEKDTGRGAFEMVIWKQAPSQWIGMDPVGVITPEQGPNMNWNTKYSIGSREVMEKNQNLVSTDMITKEKALEIGRAYLDSNLEGARVEDATQFYGYYRIDYTINGKIAGMLSVFSYTGWVSYYSWHGDFVQEAQV